MRTLRSIFILPALAWAGLLAGCGSSGIGGILGGGNDGRYDPRYDDVRGTVERVDTYERRIVVDREDDGRYLRDGGDETYVYYDDRTTVEHGGRTFRPQDLERGDRIAADVEPNGDRLVAQQIQVLYDVSGGVGSEGDGGWDDGRGTSDLRGTVRYVDTRDRTLEIDASGYGSNFSTGGTGGRSDLIVVRYDAQTVVEFEGRRYEAENLERGDEVEVELRELGNGQWLAEEIVVVRDTRLGR